jgi:O-antigen ligase
MHHKRDKALDSSIVISIFALFTIPFLITLNFFPISKFYSEMSALVLSGLIAVLTIYRAKRICISHVSIACALFAMFLVLQIFVVAIRLPGINLIIALEFLVGLALSIGIASYINDDEGIQTKLVASIAWAAAIGALIQGVFGFFQFTGIAENETLRRFILFAGTDAINVFGNIGQKNDYVDFISIGVFALAYLYFIRQLNLITYILSSTFLLTIISITTSRTTFTYFIFAFLATLIFMWANRQNPNISKLKNKQTLVILAASFIALLIIEAILPKVITMLSDRSEVTSGLYRFGSDSIGQSTYRRFYEWYKNLVIFINHPIFGIGWYQYPREAIYMMLSDSRFTYIPANSALYTHSHNSPLNILAETGIVGFAITMLYGFIYSLYRMFRRFNNHATLFLSFMLLTIFAQGLFQYPWWYAYFLMFFILFLSVNKPIFIFENTKFIKAIISFVFIVFLWFCALSIPTYNQLVNYTSIPHDSDDYTHNVQQIEELINNSLIWQFPALMVMDTYNVPGSPLTNAALSTQSQLKYNDMLANQLPYPGALFKQIVIHKMIGDDKGALFYANIFAHGFPYFKDQFAKQLESDPRFKPELKAIDDFKYEDRSIFVKLLQKKAK